MSRPIGEVDLSVELASGLVLPTPIIAASGTFGHGDEVARLCDPRGLGAVTSKSVAPFVWDGNRSPRLAGLETGMINAIGLPGPGVEGWLRDDLPALRARGARVIGSIWGRTVDDYAAAAATMIEARTELVALEVNVSCPNTEDGARMFAQSPDATAAVLGAVRAAVGPDFALFAKLTPNVSVIVEIATAAVEGGATGLTLTNTLVGLAIDAESRRPVLANGTGGVSGTPIKPIALRAVHDVRAALPDVPIIGTGGVMHGLDAVEMLLAGATSVGVGTATFLDPRATLRITDELATWCVAHDVARVRDLTGGLQWPS
jgi:dihydroorotate dehydrogenase (NAD+) catalytic subunit